MTSPLHILLLEDDASDAELIQGLLEAGHIVCEVARVQTRAEFVAALKDSEIDLILADYKLPSFDGLSALKLAMDERPDLPFIFVSGTLGEEVAISRQGWRHRLCLEAAVIKARAIGKARVARSAGTVRTQEG